MAVKTEFVELPVEKIRLHEAFQLRNKDTLELDQLAESIEKVGMIHPPTVRIMADPEKKEGGNGFYELVAGYRRFMAATVKLKWIDIKVRVVELDDVSAMSIALAENASRKDLTPIEEAKAFQTAVNMGMKGIEIAGKVGKSESYVSNRLKLLDLIPEAIKAIDEGKVSPGHAEHALFLLADHADLQKTVLRDIIHGEDIQGAKEEAKRVLHERKEKLAWDDAIRNAKFPKCPKCGHKAAGFPWGQHDKNMVRCGNCSTGYSSTEWDTQTGEINPDQVAQAKRSISNAQEARKKIEAPRTAYFDMTMEQVNRMAHRKAVEALRKVDLTKCLVHLTISKDSSGTSLVYGNIGRIEFEAGQYGAEHFFAETANPNDKGSKKFIRTFIPYGDPKKKDYEKMADILGYPTQLRNTGKPVKEGPGKVLSSKLPEKRKRGRPKKNANGAKE